MFDKAKTQVAHAGGAAASVAGSAWGSVRRLRRSTPVSMGASLGGEVLDHSAELITTTARSREIIAALIHSELDRVVATLGLVPESELLALRQTVERLGRQVEELEGRVSAVEPAVSEESGIAEAA